MGLRGELGLGQDPLLSNLSPYRTFVCTQRSPVFEGQAGSAIFKVAVNGGKCKALKNSISLQLEDKSVFSAVVEIKNNEIVFNKVISSR